MTTDPAPYIECDNCGHPIEQHGRLGCTWSSDGHECRCDAGWLVKQVQAARRAVGLPGRWHPADL